MFSLGILYISSEYDELGCARVMCHFNNIIYLFTAIWLLPAGSVYSTCKQNMKLVTTKFKSGGLHEKHVVAAKLNHPVYNEILRTKKIYYFVVH